MAADDAPFVLYQDWVHQNISIRLDVIIYKYGKWQASWGKLFVYPDNSMVYHLVWPGKCLYRLLRRTLAVYNVGSGTPSV